MSNIHIPPEALEAAVNTVLKRSAMMNDPPISDLQLKRTRENVRAACLAMLNAWPGMIEQRAEWESRLFAIILPLPQEKAE